jgi:hypothetical protein
MSDQPSSTPEPTTPASTPQSPVEPTPPPEAPVEPTAPTTPPEAPVGPTPAPAAPDTPAAPDAPQEAPQTPQEAPPASSSDRDRELEELRAQLAQAQEDKQAAVDAAIAQSQGNRPRDTGTSVDLSDVDQRERRKRFADWPEEGGSDLPQPWDLRGLGLQNAARDFADESKPGTRNSVSPIVISHGRPTLTSGSTDPGVQELGRILGDLGFPNSVSDGQNPFGSVDNTVMAAVHAFRDAYGVQEDPSGFGGDTPDGRAMAAAHIGPWTWEAILRMGRRLEADEAA